ncbi:MAG: alpha/beta hydrolase [Cyclobacteriaceae bacterium]|jgi:pimeloyl-ACP methyl ester carboxylesterase|nr:alpha/beta hydrolase [Cyclobacteriaceae bacterium]
MKKKKPPLPWVIRVVRWIFPKLERLAPALAHRYFVRIFFTPVRYRATEKETEVAQRARQSEVRVRGRHVHVYEWGEASTYVLCVHGWAGRATQFRKFIEPLNQAGFRVVALDGPAHGRSEGKQTNILDFYEAVRAVVDKHGAPEGVVSHSFGGGVTLYCAMKGLPFKRVVNIASPAVADEIIDSYLRVINGSAGTREAFKKYVLRTYGKPFEEFTAMHFVGHLPPDTDVLLIHDRDDKDVWIAQPRALAKAHPRVKLIETEGLGHNRILKDEGVISMVLDFVTDTGK